MNYLAGVFLALTATAVSANDWNCRNHAIEISCQEGQCETTDGFTPLDVYINREGDISIGMYTGVWEGKGKTIEAGEHLIIIGKELVFSTAPETKADFFISIDTSDNIAFIKGFGYAMPMTCEVRKK